MFSDKLEKTDLSGNEKKRRAELGTMLDKWLEETGAQIPAANPKYDAGWYK